MDNELLSVADIQACCDRCFRPSTDLIECVGQRKLAGLDETVPVRVCLTCADRSFAELGQYLSGLPING